MFQGLLPIGSVVLLKDSTKRVMIIGVCQKGGSDPDKIWDYAGVVFPEGYMAADKVFLFDTEQIGQIYQIGYLDVESINFKNKADEAIKNLKNK